MSKIYQSKLHPVTRYALIHPCSLRAYLGLTEISELVGMLDTGATHTSIGQDLVERLKLTYDAQSEIDGYGGKVESNHYNQLQVTFPNFTQPFTVNASCSGKSYRDDFEFDFIIGMDIIKRLNFSIETETKSFTLDFSKTKL